MPLHAVNSVLMTQRMGSVSIKIGLGPEHIIFLSLISTKCVFILVSQKPSPRCAAYFIKELLLFGQLCVLYIPSWEEKAWQRGVHTESWPVQSVSLAPCYKQLHPGGPWFSEGIGGVFISVIHSPGKPQPYLTNLVSEKSGNLIAFYNLVNDIF